MAKIPFIGGTYQARSKVIDCQECINYYPEINGPDAKSVAALIGTPGLRKHVDFLLDKPIRGIFSTSTGRLFCACDVNIYEVSTATNGYSLIGSLNSNSGPVNFADNGTQLIVVDGVNGFIYNLNTAVYAQITDNLFPNGATSVKFIDGYFVVNEPNSGRMWISTSYDGLNWSNNDFVTAEGSPDNLLAIGKVNNELWLMGSQTSEVWYDAGGDTSIFERIHGGLNEIGCSAAQSVATNANSIFWLGSNSQGAGIVWMATGYQPQRISTHGIEYQIGTFERIDNALGFCYQQEGHSFYVLSFPTPNRTFCFDLTTGYWHERASYDDTHGVNKVWRACCSAYFNGGHYVGDINDSKIYILDMDYYKEDTGTIKRVRTAQHLSNENKRYSYNRLELEMERANGLPWEAPIESGGNPLVSSNTGIVPQVMLQFSDDGGYTWSNTFIATSGKIGAYKTRVKWHRLGQGRDRVFRVSITDPVKCVICDAYAEIEEEVL